ncbi:MAG: hypothetical protein L0Y38_09675, partial [Methylococcaceae bacterium]|nr:hypothetical protein [Methylococcaceae bacterium]MCI0734075.1 hypothetical protein [Methylococcaceae bacterium]
MALSSLFESGYDAEVKIGIKDQKFSVSARKMLQYKTPMLWLQGDQVTEWIVGGPFVDANNKAHPHLAGRFAIR